VLRRHFTVRILALGVGVLVAGCAGRAPAPVTAPVVPVAAVVTPPAPAPPPAPVVAPVDELIATSRRHFDAAQSELRLGHLEGARREFNRSLEVLMESPFGGRLEPRIREYFDDLVERISAFEVSALAQGDGFAEKQYEPASIDELLSIATFDEPVTTETKAAVTADVASAEHDIDIPLNARVLAYVELFSGRLKGYLQDGLSRGAQFLPMIQEVFRAEGLPLDLAYVPLVESAFKSDALSRAKAKGMWQFMHGTALENGLNHDWYIDERADPEKATRAAARYLKTLYGMFGDWHLALASYNGGPGRVQGAIRRSGGVTDFWRLSASRRYLPRETRDYVPLILAAMIIARNPAQYGMDVQPELFVAAPFETVTLPGTVDLRRVAEWAGVSVQTIQDMNPELRRWTTPIRSVDYTLKVPVGSASLVQQQAADAGPDAASLSWHTVRKGETLLSISRKLKVSRADLAEANYLSVKSRVATGQQLIIPRAPTLLLTARTDNPAPPVDSQPIESVAQTQDALPAAAVAQPAADVETTTAAPTKVVYRVKSGDTLSSIARVFRTSVASLKKWNSLSGNTIRVGDRLTILTAPRAVAFTN